MGSVSGPKRYRRKPVVVEAMRYTDAASCDAIHDWLGWEHYHAGLEPCGTADVVVDFGDVAQPGDWVVRHVHGYVRAMADEAFTAHYEEAPDA